MDVAAMVSLTGIVLVGSDLLADSRGSGELPDDQLGNVAVAWARGL